MAAGANPLRRRVDGDDPLAEPPRGWRLEAAARVPAAAGEAAWRGFWHLVNDLHVLIGRRRPHRSVGRPGHAQDGWGEGELEPAVLEALLRRMWRR